VIAPAIPAMSALPRDCGIRSRNRRISGATAAADEAPRQSRVCAAWRTGIQARPGARSKDRARPG
jgi:hypothetical protein